MYGNEKINEEIKIKCISYDIGTANIFGYGENDQFGHFVLSGIAEIEMIEDEQRMIYF